MKRIERYRKFLDYFTSNHPEPVTELEYSNPFELLVAVILSAQCTDKRVNMVTPSLFKNFPNPETMASSTFEDVFPHIKSISYPNNKTKHLLGMARMLKNEFNSQVPADINLLQKLPGVGRKTANVIASVIYNLPAMAVDTHVFRVSKRIGLVNQNLKTPLAVENQLTKHIPAALLPKAHHWLILHGRYICTARKPNCEKCGLTSFCRFYQKNNIAETPSEMIETS
jgi:endonuclease-3